MEKDSYRASLTIGDGPHPAVASQLAAVEDLSTFLGTAGQLTLEDRRRLVGQARVLVEDFYAHLPLKKAMHAVDPAQRLKLLEHRLIQSSSQTMLSELQFHSEMLETFNSLRDLHTNYILPSPYAGKIAFLPFLVEECFDDGKQRYIVSRLLFDFSHETFQPGVEVVYWNGVPIRRAVEVNGENEAGSNIEARLARGLEGLTIRPLSASLPPDEEWVVVNYRTQDGEEHELRFDWRVFTPDPENGAVDPDSGNLANSAALGLDLLQDQVRLAKKVLFAPHAVAAEKEAAQGQLAQASAGALPTAMPTVFSAREVSTSHGTFGYIRIFTFNVNDPDGFVNEFVRLAEALPSNGLIIDVRDNGGGHIHASERLLQVLTPASIEPEPVQFIATPATLELCRLNSPSPLDPTFDLSEWRDSLAQAVETGSTYSRGFSITSGESANALGQKYHGPVVLITNALCYSATDIFAAGFQDHHIGPILGTSGNTGAGGANVFTHGLLELLMQHGLVSPFQPLPHQANMRVSIRRTLRVGERAGTPLEDLGVVPDYRHQMTKNDVLNGNVDLIETAGVILAQLPSRLLDATVTNQTDGVLKVEVNTLGISRIDVYLNSRPQRSLDVTDGTQEFSISDAPGGSFLELRGFDHDKLIASRKIRT
jgi:hypothetical protein